MTLIYDSFVDFNEVLHITEIGNFLRTENCDSLEKYVYKLDTSNFYLIRTFNN